MRLPLIVSGPRAVRLCLLSLLLPGLAEAGSRLQDGDTLVLCGDSITEQRIYTVLIEDYLLMCQPANIAGTAQLGWSGERITALHGRLASDLVPFRPTAVTLLYGMNDGGYSPPAQEVEQSFHAETAAVIRELHAHGVRLILVGSPCAVDLDRFKSWLFAKCSPEVYNDTLLGLGRAAQAAAQEQGAVWVDVHGTMLSVMRAAKARYGPSYSLSVDGVHPGPNGQLVIASAFLKAMGCDGEIGSIDFDIATGKAAVSEGHRVLDSSPRGISLESTRYPFCFTDDPGRADSTATVLPFLPFNDELNRFRLVVRQAPAHLQVTWGDETRIFTGAELAQGINLCAAFARTPFQEAFAAVESAIRQQQEFETPAVKSLLNGLASVDRFFPAGLDLRGPLSTELLRRDAELNQAARSLVHPVRHRLRFEPVPASLSPP